MFSVFPPAPTSARKAITLNESLWWRTLGEFRIFGSINRFPLKIRIWYKSGLSGKR